MTILNVGYGVLGETVIINNKNGKVYRTNLFDVNMSMSKRLSSPGVSINFGNIQGSTVYSAENIDRIILGSSVGLQGCYGLCLGAVRTQGGNTIYTYGGGNPQIGITGGSMKYSGVNLSRTEINKFLKK